MIQRGIFLAMPSRLGILGVRGGKFIKFGDLSGGGVLLLGI